jgi:hypothetical protein
VPGNSIRKLSAAGIGQIIDSRVPLRFFARLNFLSDIPGSQVRSNFLKKKKYF